MVSVWHRRNMIGGLTGIGLTGAAIGALAQNTSGKMDFEVPPGACDCHHHIYDDRFVTHYGGATPPNSTVSDYQSQVMKPAHISRDVVVLPANYGTDNRSMLDALMRLGPASRGVAKVRLDISDDELNEMNKAGVRGVRVQFSGIQPPIVPPDQIEPLAQRIHKLGWHMQFWLTGDQYPPLEQVLLRLPTPLVIDHMGHIPPPDAMQSAGYKTIRKLIDTGRCWVKVSNPYTDTLDGPPDYSDTSEIAKSYIKAAPERVLWATNWPYPDAKATRPDAVGLLNLFGRWVSDRKLRHRILVENPEAVYGFDPAGRPKAL